ASELADMTRLHELSARLLREEELAPSLHRVLDASVRVLGADNGHIQLVEEDGKMRRIVAYVGFTQDLPGGLDSSSPGAALGTLTLERGERVIVEDVHAHPQFARIASACAADGFVSGQATPLANSAGAVVGILSTHFLRPHRPDERAQKM